MPATLRWRLVLVSGCSILGAIALFAGAALLLVRHELRSSLDRALRERAQVVAELAVSAPAVLTAPGALESPGSARQIVVEVIDAHGRILARSATLGARVLPEDALVKAARVQGRPGSEDVRLTGEPFRLYAVPIAQVGGPASGGVVLVGSETSDISTTLADLALVLALAGTGIALVAVLTSAVMTRRGLLPLRRLTRGAAEIERTADPARRLPAALASRADEVAQLSGVLNRMLASLERARESERRLLADASHELRTPVTALLGNVEYALRHGADANLLAELLSDARRLARLVDDLLALEHQEAAEPQLVPLSLSELAEASARDHERVRVVASEPVHVLGDRQALERLLANLIDNAATHGPRDGWIDLSIVRADDRALLTVRDEGPGPPADERERLFERFWRGRAAAELPGSGLGLSIVASIAERHGGRITVEGSAFTVELPVADR